MWPKYHIIFSFWATLEMISFHFPLNSYLNSTVKCKEYVVII